LRFWTASRLMLRPWRPAPDRVFVVQCRPRSDDGHRVLRDTFGSSRAAIKEPHVRGSK
jgi:hypothetical protein